MLHNCGDVCFYMTVEIHSEHGKTSTGNGTQVYTLRDMTFMAKLRPDGIREMFLRSISWLSSLLLYLNFLPLFPIRRTFQLYKFYREKFKIVKHTVHNNQSRHIPQHYEKSYSTKRKRSIYSTEIAKEQVIEKYYRRWRNLSQNKCMTSLWL